MKNKVMELRRQQNEKLAEARQINSQSETRALTADEETRFNSLMADVDALQTQIEREERLALFGQEGNGRRTSRDIDPSIGMSDTDLRNYSLVRAIRASVNFARGQKDAWDEAGLEMEASRAVEERMGKAPQGFYLPFDVMNEQRDLNVGTGSAGGDLVATDLLATSFIQLLRNRMMVRTAGATVLMGLVGNIDIPRQTGAATAYWVSEGNSPSESQQTIDQVEMTPKTIGAFTDYTRKLLKQSSIDVENFVRSDLASVLALGIDLAGLHGTGDNNQPRGIATTVGIGAVVGGDNGAAPTWSHIVDLETKVATANADVGRLAYMTNAKVRGKLKTTPKVASTDSVMIWDNNAQPINGYVAHVTNQVRSNLTKGSANGVCSAIFFGNWADLFVAMWGALDILVDPYTHSTSGGVRVVALQEADIAARHPESFAAMLDALT